MRRYCDRSPKLAETIWHEHYEPILGVDQVNYMVEHFQSLRAMKDQIANQGYRYRGVFHQGKLCGYVATAGRPDFLFLSKLYLAAEARGLGLASRVLAVLKEEAKAGTGRIQLTVNRFNADSIAVYQNGGFVTSAKKKHRLAGLLYGRLYHGAGLPKLRRPESKKLEKRRKR